MLKVPQILGAAGRPEKLTVDEYAHERLMLWMMGADPPQKMAVTERALEFSVL